jgi:hypothetical protein
MWRRSILWVDSGQFVDYIALNGRMTDELKRILEEAVVT